MPTIDVLLHGIPGRSSQGYLGQAAAAMVDEKTVVDTGSLARRPMLTKAFEENVDADLEDIDNVVLTHVHFDHSDNVDLFPNATVYVYEEEWNRLESGDFDWATPRGGTAAFDDVAVELFGLGDEVAGMEAIATPGHTEHHVGFVLEGELTYCFTGDAVKNTREVATRNPMVLFDTDAAIETIDRVCDLADFVVAGHDTPFYIDDDGNPISAIDVDFGVNLQMSPASATSTEISSNRSVLKGLPEEVNDATARQSFH